MIDCSSLSGIFTICKIYWHIHPFILFSNHSITSTNIIIIKGYAKNGYSIREISHIAQAAIFDFENEYILTKQVAKFKKEKNNGNKTM